MAAPDPVVAQSAVVFQSQPEIPAPGKCNANIIPNNALKTPASAGGKSYTGFFGKWCRAGSNGNEALAIIPDAAHDGSKSAHTVKMLLSNGGAAPQTLSGVLFWDTRQNRWSLFTGGHIGWLQSNGDMAFGVAKKSGKKFKVAKGGKAQWGAYKKVR